MAGNDQMTGVNGIKGSKIQTNIHSND